MEPLRHPLFIGSVALFLLNQALQYLDWALPFLSSYGDDFVFLPILLTCALSINRIRSSRYTLPGSHIFTAFLFISFFFEIVLPEIKSDSVRDEFDLFAYGAGAALFYYFINPPKHSLDSQIDG